MSRLIYYVGFSASVISLAAALILFVYFRYEQLSYTDISPLYSSYEHITVSFEHNNWCILIRLL